MDGPPRPPHPPRRTRCWTSLPAHSQGPGHPLPFLACVSLRQAVKALAGRLQHLAVAPPPGTTCHLAPWLAACLAGPGVAPQARLLPGDPTLTAPLHLCLAKDGLCGAWGPRTSTCHTTTSTEASPCPAPHLLPLCFHRPASCFYSQRKWVDMAWTATFYPTSCSSVYPSWERRASWVISSQSGS